MLRNFEKLIYFLLDIDCLLEKNKKKIKIKINKEKEGRKYSGQASPLKEIVLDSNCLSQVHRLHYRKTQRPSFETNVRCRYLFAIHPYMCPIRPQQTDKANLWCKILNLLGPVNIYTRNLDIQWCYHNLEDKYTRW